MEVKTSRTDSDSNTERKMAVKVRGAEVVTHAQDPKNLEKRNIVNAWHVKQNLTPKGPPLSLSLSLLPSSLCLSILISVIYLCLCGRRYMHLYDSLQQIRTSKRSDQILLLPEYSKNWSLSLFVSIYICPAGDISSAYRSKRKKRGRKRKKRRRRRRRSGSLPAKRRRYALSLSLSPLLLCGLLL
jgi:hypothetical protein